jgi:hypothetical protein
LFYSEPFENTLTCDLAKSHEIIKPQLSDLNIVVYCHQKSNEHLLKIIDAFVLTNHNFTNIVVVTIRIETSIYVISNCVYEYDKLFQKTNDSTRIIQNRFEI